MKEIKSLNDSTRESNFELLRIIAMILILAHHYALHGKFDIIGEGLSINKAWIQFLSLGGKFGINIFILISGYFMINSKFNLKKIIKLILQVTFYTVSCYILAKTTNVGLESNLSESIKNGLKAILPIPYSTYLFVTSYTLLYIISPYLNILIKNMNEKMLLKLIIIGVIICSFSPTFFNADFGLSGNQFIWFVLLYLIAAYIRIYPKNIFGKFLINFIISIVLYLGIFISVIVFDILGYKWMIFNKQATYFANCYSFILLVSSICLFLAFKNINLQSKIINMIAASTFGVYLLHDNYLIRSMIWSDIFDVTSYYDSSTLILSSVIIILIIFLFCTIIDWVRVIFIENPIMNYVNRNWYKLEQYFSKLKQV